jgi:hypothetical protein
MSTMEFLATGWRAARQASAQARAQRVGTRTRGRLLAAVVEHGLAVAGLGCFTAAALMVAVPLGLVAAGVALFVLEWRVGE